MQLSRRWNQFFFSDYDPAALGLFRIIFGLFLAVAFAALFPNWDAYYGPGGLRLEPAGADGWSAFVWTQRWIPISFFWYLGFLASLALTIGWKTRWMVATLFVVQSSMVHANPLVVNGEDLVIRMLLFYGFFAPLDYSFSLDQWIRLRKGINTRPPAQWPLRLMQINIALIYAFSLPQKLVADASWYNGEALYWVMMNSTWNRWAVLQPLAYHPHVTAIMTFSAVLAEGLFPILVWFRRTRAPILVAITLFHVGLAVLLQYVTFFSLAMACSFLLFVPGEAISSLLHVKRGAPLAASR